MSNFKYAEKNLCIGGSTLNSETLENLRNSLIQTNFLEDWAIIFANHCYFKLQSVERYIEKINSDFEGLKLVFVYQELSSPYIVERCKIYIISDSMYSNLLVDVEFKIQDGVPLLKVESIPDSDMVNQALEEHWIDSLDASGKERNYKP